MSAHSVTAQKRLAFLLLPEYAVLSYASVIVPFHYVNYALAMQAYELCVCSFDGAPVRDVTGVTCRPDFAATALPGPPDVVIVCGGRNVERYVYRPMLGWLRDVARHGAQMAAVSTGSYTLAAAGLLDGYRATIHWQNQASFSEAFPHVNLTASVFEIDRNRLTCGGGTTATDLALQVILKDHGTYMAMKCAEEFMHDRIRTTDDLQQSTRQIALKTRSAVLAKAVDAIDDAQPDRIPLDQIAAAAGVSTRHLERLFRDVLNTTPARYIAESRMLFARRLLRQSDMKILDIAAAASFSSPSYFCQSYKNIFGISPRDDRKQYRATSRKPSGDLA